MPDAADAAPSLWTAPLSRRRFLQGLGLAGVSLALGQLGVPSARAQATTTADTPLVFPQSVASGDPTPDGGILWTRIGPSEYDPAEPVFVEVAPGAGPTGDSGPALTAFLADAVVAGTVPAGAVSAGDDHTIHFALTGQAPDSRVRYRFVHKGVASRIGVLRTLPAANAAVPEMRIAQVTCQHYNRGHYTAYRAIAAEAGEDGTGIDYMLHLGDLIYEYFDSPAGATRKLSAADQAAWEAEGGGYGSAFAAAKLSSYRLIHRIYRDDPDYQLALERCTLVATWDDHEVRDNWTGKGSGVLSPIGAAATAMPVQRFTGGVKAWTEWVPTRVQFPPQWTPGLTGGAVTYDQGSASTPGDWTLYRDFRLGTLAHLWVTDLQWFKDRALSLSKKAYPAALPPETPAYETPPKSPLNHSERPNEVALGTAYGAKVQTHLGPRQKAWLVDGIKAAAGAVAWNVWGCSKPMAQAAGVAVHPRVPGEEANTVDKTADASVTNLGGTWADYAPERDEVLTAIARTNTIVLAGDNHRPQAAVLRERVGDPTSLPAAVEFMTPAISSNTGHKWDDSVANPSDASQGPREGIQHTKPSTSAAEVQADAEGEAAEELARAQSARNQEEITAGVLLYSSPDTRYAPKAFRGYSVLTLTPERARWEVHAVNCKTAAGGETGVSKAFLVPHGVPAILDDVVDNSQRGLEHDVGQLPEAPQPPELPETPEVPLPALPTDTGSAIPLLLSKVPAVP